MWELSKNSQIFQKILDVHERQLFRKGRVSQLRDFAIVLKDVVEEVSVGEWYGCHSLEGHLGCRVGDGLEAERSGRSLLQAPR